MMDDEVVNDQWFTKGFVGSYDREVYGYAAVVH